MMTRKQIREIAEFITNEEIAEMLENAKNRITDWRETSIVNKGLTKGVQWNIFGKPFNIKREYHHLAKFNMVREFQKYLPEHLKYKKKDKLKTREPVHQDPEF